MADSPPESQSPEDATNVHQHLRILHGVLSLDVGGLERIVLDLIRAGRAAGHEVTVLCIERPGALAPEAEQLGAVVRSLDKPPGRHTMTIRDTELELAALKPDVIHTHQIGALWYVGQANRASRIPIVHTEHGNHLAATKGKWQRFKTRMLIHQASRYADRFCCVSDEIARAVQRWRTVSKRKIEVVVNGIRTDVFEGRTERSKIRQSLGIEDASVVIGTVGRLSEVKCQELLIKSVAQLSGRFPKSKLLLVGDGPRRTELEREATALGVANRVIFAGYQARPEQYYQAMDIFALTSRSEGLPLSLLEAWAAGLPVVCSAVGGIPKVVSNGRNGLLFPSGDLPALTAALASLLADQSAMAQLASAGCRHVREFHSLERMAKQYDHMYRRQLGTAIANAQ